jgi:5-methylcytosine-specific restriction endonuclease McrBC regulatory subunit McrC
VFEHHVTQAIVEAFAGVPRFGVHVQERYALARPLAGAPEPSIRPDVTIDQAGRPWLVLDVKWKDIGAASAEESDLYQVLAYAAALGARRALLVYPGCRHQVRAWALANGPLRLEVHTLRVVGSRASCLRSLERLARRIRQGRGST